MQHGTHQALRLLGRGTAADTWLFRDIKLSKPVAIKMFQRPIDYYPVSAVQREVMVSPFCHSHVFQQNAHRYFPFACMGKHELESFLTLGEKHYPPKSPCGRISFADKAEALMQTQTELGPGHINLINVYELFLTPEHLGLVMECAEGGSLTTYVGACWEKAQPHSLVLPEDEVLYLFKQFISAVAYCHSHTIAHRQGLADSSSLSYVMQLT